MWGASKCIALSTCLSLNRSSNLTIGDEVCGIERREGKFIGGVIVANLQGIGNQLELSKYTK